MADSSVLIGMTPFAIVVFLVLLPFTAVAQSLFPAMEQAIVAGRFQKIGSVVVEQDGHVVYEHYFEGDAASLRDTRSATKSITSVLTGIAIDEHKISSVSTLLIEFFPKRVLQNPDSRKSKITLEDLLTMSSSFECDDWNDFSRGNEERMYVVEDWTQFALDLPIRGYARFPGEMPPKYGRRFSYCTAGAFLMGEVLKYATRLPADVHAQRKLFDPLGIHDARWVYSPLGLPQTGGGLRLSNRDLLKIAELYRLGGKIDGKQIVSENWVRASTTAHVQIDDKTEYGYFW